MKTFIYALFCFICAFMIYGCDNDDDDNGNMTSQLPDNLPDVNNATFSNSTSITNNLYGPLQTKFIFMKVEKSGWNLKKKLY
ncbi:hypothetical protein [Zhouia amylolytica]|uniref:Uncharacterized protein n=1 Tax=Zhouia amylolytica AD3 TaxID=1286632 RepID=W2UNT7_9FLAO|nr:hypothetical protein [Zhouia amylolytica]ETN95668.1 hypothetical protein P278_13900 [Zhouia amylolytica AD3]